MKTLNLREKFHNLLVSPVLNPLFGKLDVIEAQECQGGFFTRVDRVKTTDLVIVIILQGFITKCLSGFDSGGLSEPE